MSGQGATEYMLILAAVFAIVVVAVLVLNAVLESPTQAWDVNMDITNCGNNHTWLKEYVAAYDGTSVTAPKAISYYETDARVLQPDAIDAIPESTTKCRLQDKFKLNLSTNRQAFYLQKNDTHWFEYSGEAVVVECFGGKENKDEIELVEMLYIFDGNSMSYLYWKSSTTNSQYGKLTFSLSELSGYTINFAKVCAHWEDGINYELYDFVSAGTLGNDVTTGNENDGDNYYCKTIQMDVVQNTIDAGADLILYWERSESDTTQWSRDEIDLNNKPYMEVCY